MYTHKIHYIDKVYPSYLILVIVNLQLIIVRQIIDEIICLTIWGFLGN